MLFAFLKYINPIWYFNLIPHGQSIPYFVDYRKLDKEELTLLDIDNAYHTEAGLLADAAYQAWQKGIMKTDSTFSLYESFKDKLSIKQRTLKLFENCSVTVNDSVYVSNIHDNYRFVRRFFDPAISWYILLVRILSLHNPAQEINSFVKTLRVKRIDLWKTNSWPLLRADFESFESPLVKQQPMVSVIIPTLNRYLYLKDVLSDLEKQDYRNFEVIVCDQSDNFTEDFYEGWNLNLILIRQETKALCKARNVSMIKSSGDYILLFDDDSRVNQDWITQHLKCIDHFNADISTGVSLSVVGNNIPKNYSYFRWSDQLDTGNVMFRKEILSTTGMLDGQFEGQTNEDAEFGLRFYLLGFKAVSNHLARRIHLKAPIGGMREMSGWDSLRPTRLFAPRPVPSVLYLSRKYYGNNLSLLLLLFSIPGSVIPYKYKSNKWLKALASLLFIVIWPFLLIQVIISWQQAGKKLKEGANIEKL